MSGYIAPFLIGGVTVAGIKFLSNRVDPKYAAVLGALPIGLISTYYIKDTSKLDDYLTNYTIMAAILIITALTFKFLMFEKFSRTASYIDAILIWIAIVIAKIKLF